MVTLNSLETVIKFFVYVHLMGIECITYVSSEVFVAHPFAHSYYFHVPREADI